MIHDDQKVELMKIKVEIDIHGLPERHNHHPFAVNLESEIEDAVARALDHAFEDGIQGKEWSVRVPTF